MRWICAAAALTLSASTGVRAAKPMATGAEPMTFYVSTQGNDAWSGTLPAPKGKDGPFATLERARDAVRQLKRKGPLPAGGVTVANRGGAYRLTKSFELGEEDSGAAEAPIVYQAYPGETVRLVGGPTIPPGSFVPVTDVAILKRLDVGARGKVLQADLKALGVADFGQPFPATFRGYAGWPELFFDRQPMQIARWPNEGFARVAKVLDSGSKPRVNEKPDRPGKFVYEGDRPARWLTADEVTLNGYWCFKWYNECIRVAKIDPAEKSITFAAPHVYGVGGPSGGFYFALNLLEELDQPGEYFLDRKAGILYFWPPAPIAGKEIGLSLLDAPMIVLNNVSHVTLRGFVFEFSKGLAVAMTGGTGNILAGCTIRNLATDAVRISGGTANGVRSCDLYNLGGAGIALDGGDRATLTPCNHFAENNHIHHYGRLFRTHRDAISLGGVGCRASHNLIHDAPHHAMDFGGNCHMVELNEIHDVCTETDDAGAIYTGRDWTVRGTVIRHNFFHDVGGSAHVGNQAIYVDDNACGVTSVGNVIYRVYRAFLIGGGRENVMDNNVIVECPIPMHVDNRGLSDWAGRKSENWTTLTDRLKAVPYQSEPWKTRFPELVSILEDEPEMPKRNRVTRNLVVGCGEMSLAKEAREQGTIEANWATREDPGFVDAASLNFALKPDAPAFQQIPGFERIPFEKIGLYRDDYRKVLPVRAPAVVPAPCAFVEEMTLRLTADSRSQQVEIRYTLDGSEPTLKSPLYKAPLKLTQSTTLKAAAFASAGGAIERSGTVTAAYKAQQLGAGIALGELPALDLLVHGGLKVDTNYSGKGPLTLAGRAYQRGLMMHPETTPEGGRARATWELSGGLAKATRFRAVVGLDAEIAGAGSVAFIVEVERGGKWERVYESPVLRGSDTREVSVDITGARKLRLVVTDGGDKINSDHAVWADAVVQ